MGSVFPVLLATLVCWVALCGLGHCFDFEECTKPCWEVYNMCRANAQLASCNPPMKTCMDNCMQLKDAVSRSIRLSDDKRSDSTHRQQNIKGSLHDTDGDGWDDWEPSLAFHI